MRPGADDAHFALQDVDQLGKLVEAGAAQELSDARDPLVIATGRAASGTIARVTGKTGRMMQKKQAEGDIVSQTGSTVGKYTVDYADPVDAPIIEIVAARCGPLAVGEGVGMAKEDGSVGSP